MTDLEIAEMRRMWSDGASVKEIAARLNYSYRTIVDFGVDHRDMFPRKRQKVDEEEMSRHMAMIMDGKSTVAKSASEMSVNKETIRRRLRLCRNRRG